MKTFTEARGLTADEYESIKQSLRSELPFRVRLSQAKQLYAYGMINIGPHKTINPDYCWTEEQFDAVRSFLRRHNLSIRQQNILDGDTAYYCFKHGLNYIERIVRTWTVD